VPSALKRRVLALEKALGMNDAALMARWREWNQNRRVGREPPGRGIAKDTFRKALMELAELDPEG